VSDAVPGNGLDVTLREFTSGQKVFNRYRLVKTLGRGGMGVVWLAHDEELERDVALKFLPELVIHDRAVLGDLKRETRRSLELTHKNIVRIYDFIHDNTSGCISMEYVDGDTLSNLRADRPKKVFETHELTDWVSQLCDALDYAHTHARIVHRDLKPTNLMVNQRKDLKVADFGIARSLSDSVSKLTMQHGKSGTLVYMSPQQLEGERGTHLDDVYSLGASVYELLTSKPPFFSGNIDRQIREKVPPPMKRRREELEIENVEPIDPAWEEVVQACLAKDPTKRPQSVSEVARQLEVPSPKTRRAARDAKKSSKRVGVLAAVGAIIVLAGIGGWYWRIHQPSRKISGRDEADNAQSLAGALATGNFADYAKNLRDREIAKVQPQVITPVTSDRAESRPQADGIPERSTFGISEVSVTETADPRAETNLQLRIAVRKRPNEKIDHTKAKIQVFFYDVVDDRDLKLTDADASYEWITPKHDWAETDTEVLGVRYVRPKGKNRPSGAGHRAYLGYIVRVYYDDKLQDTRAEPQKLLNLFPAPSRPTETVAQAQPTATVPASPIAPAGPKVIGDAVYEGAIHAKNDNSTNVPLAITFGSDLKSGTMTQSGRRGDVVVKFTGVWDEATLRAVTDEVVSTPKGINWEPESFTLHFADSGKNATYECVADGKTYIADLSAQSAPAVKAAPTYKGTIRTKGVQSGPGTPLTINLAADRRSGTMTQSSKSGDTVVRFNGIWDGETLRAVTNDVISKPANIQWQPESFTLRFSGDGKRGTYECNSEGRIYSAELSPP
jgi:serine/threonine protein kinase